MSTAAWEFNPECFRDKKALVSGAAGFLGSHMADRLLSYGCRVTGIDNLSTGTLENLAAARQNPNFSFIGHDVVKELPVEGPFDFVAHLASPASPVDYRRLSIETMLVNALGTKNLLDLALRSKAVFLLASTSEVYGDPLVHPQEETYWGNVNPTGPRACYDESKRFAEALTMEYHRRYGLDIRIARIFNSILADQYAVLFNDEEMHVERVGIYAEQARTVPETRRVLVPAFNPVTLRMELRPASALIRCHPSREAYELHLRYGRRVKVTGDHSVFVPNTEGYPVPKPVREIQVGDYVAIPGKLPVIERDRTHILMAQEFIRIAEDPNELWGWTVRHPSFPELVTRRRDEIHRVLEESIHFRRTKNFRNTIVCATRKWMKQGNLPLYVLWRLGVEAPENAEIAPYGGSNLWLPNCIKITDDLLWFMGLFLAEGTEYSGRGVYFLSLSSDQEYLDRAKAILEDHFRVHPGLAPPEKGRGPQLYAHSKALHHLFVRVLGLRGQRIPSWIMQLPLSRVKHFLEGFRCGDGTHSGKKVGNELVFDTTSEALAVDLLYLLLRFGIVGSWGSHETTFRKRYGERRFPFHRITVCSLDTFDILSWDRGVKQNLNARRTGDLVWAKVLDIRPTVLTPYVYDFSVPEAENFVAGNGVCCHNTYGPRMRPDDGRVVPNFIIQALRREPLSVYGDGQQTRSFLYVDDQIDGLLRLLAAPGAKGEVINIGNPEERTILEFARVVAEICGCECRIEHQELPPDDPARRCPDITKARRLLGWEPRIPTREGLGRTIAYFRKMLSRA